MSRRVWIIVVAIVIIFLGLLAGINYAAVVASKSTNSNSTNTATSTSPDTVPTQATTNSTQVCGASVSASDLRTFQIVPQQTTASYKVRENLIAFNLPAHNAVGTTHKVTGHFTEPTQNVSRWSASHLSDARRSDGSWQDKAGDISGAGQSGGQHDYWYRNYYRVDVAVWHSTTQSGEFCSR